MRELLAERNTALAAMSERAAETRVAEALAGGYITPAMRPWALALCSEKPRSFEDFLAAGAPAFAHFLRPATSAGAPPSADAAVDASPEAHAICRQLGLAPGALTGRTSYGTGFQLSGCCPSRSLWEGRPSCPGHCFPGGRDHERR